MKLLDKQIKVVQKTKEQCIKETLENINHRWTTSSCYLCKEFLDKFHYCGVCPLKIWEEDLIRGCCSINNSIFGNFNHQNSQDLACFLYSLELYLKEWGIYDK